MVSRHNQRGAVSTVQEQIREEIEDQETEENVQVLGAGNLENSMEQLVAEGV